MQDYLTIGPTPCAEDCAQVGASDYPERGRAECTAFKHQLERQFPIPDGLAAYFITKRFNHEFGPYREVCVVYDDTNEASCNYAFLIEGNCPEYWDPIAIKELTEAGFAPTPRDRTEHSQQDLMDGEASARAEDQHPGLHPRES